MKHLLVACMLSLAIGAVASGEVIAATPSPDDGKQKNLLEIGRRIYQTGIVSSGEPLRGESAAQVTFSGQDAACIRCHRKSGLGSGEGTNIIRPIIGEYIFPAATLNLGADPSADTATPPQTILRQRELALQAITRNQYTPITFAKVLREGVDYTGKPLDRLMPRFNLKDEDVAALAAYLKTLSAHPDPGVDQASLHFSTVILPGVDPRKSQAMLAVLQAFFKDKNSGTRLERRRRTVGTEAMYRAFREWKLHVWTLTGSAESWPAQLEQLYTQQPVFAMLSGIGGDGWRPVHDFCERQALPCMFPNNDLPVTDGGYYSFYLSRGMALEAEVLAKHLGAQQPSVQPVNAGSAPRGLIVQVFRKTDIRGAQAAQLLRSNVQITGGSGEVVDWPYSDQPDIASFQKMLADKKPQTLVMWLNRDDMAKLGNWRSRGASPQQIYLSASMLGSEVAANVDLLGEQLNQSLHKVRLIYPFALPDKSAQQLQRTKLWLQAKKIPLSDDLIQANTYFAATVVGDSISHILNHFTRDYFIERAEHMVARSLVTSVYPHVSLGPEQRFASKGAYLIRFLRQPDQAVELNAEWIVP